MARKKVTKPTATASKSTAAVEVVETKKAIPGASVGIDFGTHGVSLAAYKNGSFDLIVNDNGERSTPLYVSFNDLERAIGAPAKEASLRNHANSVHYIRAYLGSSVENLADYLKAITSYKVANNADNQACFQVTVKGEETLVTPDELITLFSEKLMTYACDFWDCKVTDAVVAVPYEFPEAAKKALVGAVEAAGFNVLATISDPVAAALSFNLDSTIQDTDKNYDTPASLLSSANADQKCILVADIGCVKSTATLIHSKNGVLEVVYSHTADVAGASLDNKLHDYFSQLFINENNVDLKESTRASLRLKQACEMVKKNLSSSISASVQLDALFEGIDLFTDITRLKFEQMCQSVWDEFNQQLTDVFAHSHGIKPSDITHVILAGGTAALNKFQSHIVTFFKKQTGLCKVEFLKHMHSGDAVVYGAAKQAYLLSVTEYDATFEARKNTAVVAGAKINADNKSIEHTIDAYTQQPLLVLSKNLYIKTFYNTYLPLVGTNTAGPSVNSIRIALPTEIPEGYVAALAIYETSAANSIAAANAADLKCVGTFALDTKKINELKQSPEGTVPVVGIVKTTITADYNISIDIGYTSPIITGAMVYSNIFTYNLLSKPIVCPKTKEDFVHTENTSVSAHSQAVSIARIQQMAHHWAEWKKSSRNQSFIKKHKHMEVVVENADKVIEKVADIINLGNPYQGNLTSFTLTATLPSANSLAEMSFVVRDALIRVTRTKGMSVAEAKAFNKNLVPGQVTIGATTVNSAAAADGEVDMDDDIDYDDLLDSDDDDDDNVDYEQYLNGDDDDDDDDYEVGGGDLD